MSEKREVNVNYGDRQFKLVRIERVYEVADDKDELIRQGGDFILNLTGHSADSWETYRSNPNSFNTLAYQKNFQEENNYLGVTGEIHADEPELPPTTPQPERPAEIAPKPEPVPEPDTDKEDIDAKVMEASMGQISDIQVEMAANPSPERMAELIGLLGAELEKIRAVRDGKEVTEIREPVAEAEATVITTEEAHRNAAIRRRSVFQRLSDRIRGRQIVEEEVVAPVGGRTIIVEEERGVVPLERGMAVVALAGFAAGALAVGGTVLTYYLLTRGHPPEAAHVFCRGENHGFGFDFDDRFGFSHKFGASHLFHQNPKHVSLAGIQPDEIHAKTPKEFVHGVLTKMNKEGLHSRGLTGERMTQLIQWLRGHKIASGMRLDSHGHKVQNLINFPKTGQHFPNSNLSAEQGFRLGPGRNSHEALIKFLQHFQQIGGKLNRS